MDKAEFKKKYGNLLNDFNKKYSKRAIKKYRELTADIRKNKIKDVNLFLGQLIGIMSELNRDYANQLVGFMLENFITDKEK